MTANKGDADFSSAYWRVRGEETRTLAESANNERLQRALLAVADAYDKLAEFTEAHEDQCRVTVWPPSPEYGALSEGHSG